MGNIGRVRKLADEEEREKNLKQIKNEVENKGYLVRPENTKDPSELSKRGQQILKYSKSMKVSPKSYQMVMPKISIPTIREEHKIQRAIELNAAEHLFLAANKYEANGNFGQAEKLYQRAKSIYDENDGKQIDQTLIDSIHKKRLDQIGKYLQKRESRKKGNSGLEKTAGLSAIIGLLGGMLFLSHKITGNAIGNIDQATSQGVGVLLFFIGLVGAFFYFKRK